MRKSILFLAAWTLSACQSPPRAPSTSVAPVKPYESVQIAGRSVEGRPIEYHVLGVGPDVALIVASIHGNEAAGTPLVESLLEHLRANSGGLHGRRVVVVPAANPDGLAKGQRHNVNEVDLNRNFPAANFGQRRAASGPQPLSEPESRALYDLLERYPPRRIVSIHQPLACIDFDGPAAELARQMGAVCELPVKKLGSRPGSLGSYAGVDLNIPIITYELPKGAEQLSRAELWSRFGPALLAAIEFAP